MWYRVWLECARSIREKMQLYEIFELAGVASWRRGFENAATWDEIGRFFR
jgi:spore germination protein YaaH